MNFQAVLDAVRLLPVDEQARLIDQIQDDLLTQEAGADLIPELMQELDRRLADGNDHDLGNATVSARVSKKRTRSANSGK